MSNLDPAVVIRAARGSDGTVLDNLARMDSQRPLNGDILVAEQGGRIVAAISGDRAVADPFRPTVDLLALLRVHAGRPQHVARARSRVRVPLLRHA